MARSRLQTHDLIGEFKLLIQEDWFIKFSNNFIISIKQNQNQEN